LLLGLAALVAVVAWAALKLSSGPPPAPPVATPPLPRRPAPTPPAAWLGLDYNSSAHTARLRDFAARGIVYDREDGVEVNAGKTPANDPRFAGDLSTSYAAQMVPDIEVDLASGPRGCQGNPNPSKLCLPTDETSIGNYVRGFIQTVTSVRQAHPGKTVLFEPMNEPWTWASPPGTYSGTPAATQYAAILAQLLPAAKASGIPLSDIYVPATGALDDGTSWISDLYKAQPCLKPGPSTCGPIAGWNLHPYGRPDSSTEGIQSVPRVRAGMLSGLDNLVVSEIGFCANDVSGGKNCNVDKDIVGTSAQTAAWLTATLKEAAPMHQAGWLKALLVWERTGAGATGSGWAMQYPDGRLTAQGRALDLFADSPAGR
jgi:hypothetical protein